LKAGNLRLAALAALLCAAPAFGTIIVPDFVKAEIPPNSTQVTLPYVMDKTHDILFLKFNIPNFSQIVSIESFVLNVILYDNADGGGESGDIEFAQPSTNLFLANFFTLNHTDASNPALFTLPLCPCEITQISPSLQDGNFRIRFARDTGDFIVGGAAAIMDVTLAPEPATTASIAGGLLALVAFRTRRRNKPTGVDRLNPSPKGRHPVT